MGALSRIRTARQVDSPVSQSASYRANAIDRAFIDEQIRATQLQIVQNLINGVIGTWFILDGGSRAVVTGDVVCAASNIQGITVTAATAGALATAGQAVGVVILGGAPGAPIQVAVFGLVPPSVSSLAAASPGGVRVNTATQRLQQVASYSIGDYPCGAVDNAGNLSLAFAIAVTGSVLIGNSLTQQPLTSGGDVNQTLAGTAGNILYPITALTAARQYTMPVAPTVNMACTIVDTRSFYTGAITITLTTSGGTDTFYTKGALSTLNSGHSLLIDPTIFKGQPFTIVRATSTTWEMWL